ncbi:MAG TPA: low temperature requirement protein A [Solirubrobacteraceae bacterium]
MSGVSEHTVTGVPEEVAQAASPERRTSPVELLWDLVFAFALTQVITLLARQPTWAGLGRSMLALALVWWAWSAFVWVANAFEDSSRELRLVLLVGMGFIFVAGLALPEAFGSRGTLFAVTYAVVRVLHLGLYARASRAGRAQWSAIAGFALTVAVGMALLIAGSFFHSSLRTGLWLLAAAIDYAGPAWLTRERLRGLQRVAVAHFAERYGLFVIICLGESIVVIGTQASSSLSAHVLVVFSLCVVATVGLWWTYFDQLAGAAEERLRTHDDPVLAAADAYSYIHLVIVAGIIVFAVGAKLVIGRTGPGGLALCGGVATYLIGQEGFAWRMLGTIEPWRLAVAAVLIALCPVADQIPGWGAAAIVAGLLGVLCVKRLSPRR